MNARNWLSTLGFLISLAALNHAIIFTKDQENKKATTVQEPVHRKGVKAVTSRRRIYTHARNKQPRFSKMSYDELKVAKQRRIEDNDKEASIRYIERMLKLCDDINQAAGLLLELADLYFDTGRLEKAQTLYTEFYKQYPGHAQTEYGLYRAIVCNYYELSSFDRDQTKTHDVISMADAFLNKPRYTTYRKEITNLRKKSYERLIESELNVCQFYLKKNSFKAVNKRLDHIRKQILPEIPSMQAHIVVFECSVAEKQNDPLAAEQKRKEFVNLSQTNAQAWEAAQRKLKNNFAYRF